MGVGDLDGDLDVGSRVGDLDGDLDVGRLVGWFVGFGVE